MMKRNRWMPILLALMIAALLCGCGRKVANDAGSAMPEYGYLTDSTQNGGTAEKDSQTEVADSASGATIGSIPQNQKLIRTMELDVETEDLDILLANVEARARELGGYVERKDVYRGSAYSQKVYRYGNLTIRVPADVADQFVNLVGEASNITSSREDIDDVSLQYVATESRIKALETEQARLLELLEQAKTMEDLLKIESRLTDVQSELEQVTSQLRVYDNLVNYATIRLSAQEVRQYTPVEEDSFWQRITKGLTRNLQDIAAGAADFLVFFLSGLPYWILLAAVVTAVVLWIRSRRRRRARRKPQQPNDSQ